MLLIMKVKRKRGRPSGEKAANREDILKVALSEFALKGYEGVSMTGIAKAANTSDSLLYYYFKNKESLWKEAVSARLEELNTKLLQTELLFKDLDGISILKVILRQFIYFAAENVDFNKVAFTEMVNRSERAKWMTETLFRPIHDLATSVLKEGQEKGEIKPIPLPNLVSIIIGAATTFFSHAYKMELLYGIDPTSKEEIEKHADVVNELIFSNLSNK